MQITPTPLLIVTPGLPAGVARALALKSSEGKGAP